MIWLIASILIAIILATYLSTLNLALSDMSRAALQRRLNQMKRPAAADWLYDQHHAAVLATSLLRTLARMCIYILMLALIVGLRVEATVTWQELIGSGLIAAMCIWITTIVMARAIARHRGIAFIVAGLPLLRVCTILCKPITRSGEAIDRSFGRLADTRNPEAIEDEFLQTIEDSQREGTLDIQSAEILENVVEFTNTEVSQVMTPRMEIEGINYTDDIGSIREFILHAGHSRIPVYKGTVDEIVGILYLKDLIRYLGEEPESFKLNEHLREPIVVPETKPVRELLSVFQHGKVHMAIVVDEFGSTAGLVTIEDVLEEIVGDIRDEHEPREEGEPVFKAIDPTHAEVDGEYRIDELNERLHLNIPENGDYATVGGFLLAQFGRVPSVGEMFDWNHARYTVLAATPRHVQRVSIQLDQGAGNGVVTERSAKVAK